MKSVLTDWRTARLDPKMRATLGLLETLTLSPESLSVADFAPARLAGLSDEAIAEALHVCAQFNVYARMADSPPAPTPMATPDDGARARSNREAITGTPRWVKVFVIVFIALALLFVILHLTGNGFGDHMHTSAPGHGTQPL